MSQFRSSWIAVVAVPLFVGGFLIGWYASTALQVRQAAERAAASLMSSIKEAYRIYSEDGGVPLEFDMASFGEFNQQLTNRFGVSLSAARHDDKLLYYQGGQLLPIAEGAALAMFGFKKQRIGLVVFGIENQLTRPTMESDDELPLVFHQSNGYSAAIVSARPLADAQNLFGTILSSKGVDGKAK